MLDRRTLLVAALAGAAATVTADAAFARSPAPASPVTVDVARLVAQGWGSSAPRIRAAMERELAASLGPALQRSGRRLVVSITGISMPSYTGGGSGLGGSTSDGMESEARLIGADGRLIATYPVLSSSPTGAAGPWYAPDIEARRIDNAIRTNAGWIGRYVGS